MNLRRGNFLDRHGGKLRCLGQMYDLLQTGFRTMHQVIRQHHGKGLLSHRLLRTKDGVAKAPGLFLYHGTEGGPFQKIMQACQSTQLPLFLQRPLQRSIARKMTEYFF